MLNKGFLCCVMTFLLLANLAVIALSVLHAIAVWEIVKLSDHAAEFKDQLTIDWTKKPFTNLSVTTGDCPEGWEPAFANFWEGTFEGCKLDEETIEIKMFHDI